MTGMITITRAEWVKSRAVGLVFEPGVTCRIVDDPAVIEELARLTKIERKFQEASELWILKSGKHLTK